jgi:hypothetical protein
MRGDVGKLARAVAGGGNDFSVAHDGRADRYLAALARRLGLAEGGVHEALGAFAHLASLRSL